ncbi:MAG: hypothetical protein B6D45_01320 [Ignavibacteriales bacterium UTCHB3]|nr:MAG: hypothetical protein B6D45_01320 [Ignavibacteriales bacterium UTCHB3]
MQFKRFNSLLIANRNFTFVVISDILWVKFIYRFNNGVIMKNFALKPMVFLEQSCSFYQWFFKKKALYLTGVF